MVPTTADSNWNSASTGHTQYSNHCSFHEARNSPGIPTAPPPPFPQPDPVFIGIPKSVATAVIVVNRPVGSQDPEYDQPDLRILVSRDGKQIGTPQVEFNVPTRVVTGPLPQDPQTYIDLDYDLGQDSAKKNPLYRAAYVFIPPKPNSTSDKPTVEISDDGMTPVFGSLITATNAVLAADFTTTGPGEPTSLQTRANALTAVQCKQVALELTYDRVIFPLPIPKNKALEDMYKNPDVTVADDQDRKQFEADLTSYHATHDAEATRLAAYIFAASAAIACERLSLQAVSARFTFDVVVAQPNPKAILPVVSVVLHGEPIDVTNPNGYLDPTFGVPAAYFYALASCLPDTLVAADRYRAAVIQTEDAALKSLQVAKDAGILAESEDALTSIDAGVKGLVIDQASRRLSALGGVSSSLRRVDLTNKISTVVTKWLQYPGHSEDIGVFWADQSSSQAAQYLELLLEVIVEEKTDLKQAIKQNLNVNVAADLPVVTDQRWHDFFMPPGIKETDPLAKARAALLPDYTIPGSTKQRTSAFIVALRRLLSVGTEVPTSSAQNPNDIPVLNDPQRDCLRYFFEASPNFSFANPLDENAVTTTISSLPISQQMQNSVNKAIHVLHFLFQVTSFADPQHHPPQLQFSLMEALYARGFISADRVALLTEDQFRTALAGTISYAQDTAQAIYDLAINLSTFNADLGPEPRHQFGSMNPGDLVDCVPPPNLSPLGTIQYLYEMLQLKLSTQSGTENTVLVNISLVDILSSRRGPLATMKATLANLENNLLRIDLVNESLETLGTNVAAQHGMIYNTDATKIAGFMLGQGDSELNPEKALILIPQYSSPAIPVMSPGVYNALNIDFSASLLPYSQELDINRAYVRAVEASRFGVMRTFRKSITEFVLEPSVEPSEFQTQILRFPVRYDIAIEYLCISEDERRLLFTSNLEGVKLANIYGFSPDDKTWMDEVRDLPIFLRASGLSYCEFLALWKSGFVNFTSARNSEFPVCEPCCLKSYTIRFLDNDGSATISLQKLAVFIRLWRKVEQRYGKYCLTFTGFSAVCQVLKLFDGSNKLNADFIRQLIALLMLCDVFGLRLCEEPVHALPETVSLPQQHVRILALWADAGGADELRRLTIEQLLDGVEGYAKHEHHCIPRNGEFKKILVENLDTLAELVGFTEDRPWNYNPSCTLRFAEILAKIWASTFTVGEILFLFTNEEHLTGDDPFPYTVESEAREDPLNAPEDSRHGVWKLRERLCHTSVDEEKAKQWTWRQIEQSLRREFGLMPSASPAQPDNLLALGEHFFPGVLESCGHHVPMTKRQFTAKLNPADTSVLMWDAPPHGPFHYRSSTSELWMQLPLCDEDFLEKVSHIRQLGTTEQKAVRELYFAPRATLAPFASIFGDLSKAINHMVEQPSEEKRFEYFQRCFALFHRRCEIIVEHLVAHVELATDMGVDGERLSCSKKLAWTIIKSLIADENKPLEPWERDSGEAPASNSFQWDPFFSGSAFSALLGVCGTGLLGEYTTESPNVIWKEIRGPLVAFGRALDDKNVPLPTFIPRLDFTSTEEQQNLMIFRNGFAFSDLTAANWGGAQKFSVKWQGVLLVECQGEYKFEAYHPDWRKHHEHKKHCQCREHNEHQDYQEHHEHQYHQDQNSHHHHHHHHPHNQEGENCDQSRWLVTLRRGQKIWVLLSQNWPSSDHAAKGELLPVNLSRGGYDIQVEFEQSLPSLSDNGDNGEEHRGHVHTGFGVKYCGPDTEDRLITIPRDKLFIKTKDEPLVPPSKEQIDSSIRFRQWQYISSLRDIRRTYQRAFKSILFAHRFSISDEPEPSCQGGSELEYIMHHTVEFRGTSYYPVAPTQSNAVMSAGFRSYNTHHANFDFNFLPVDDSYVPPDPGDDNREAPSTQRMSALFDWWERIFDYKLFAQQVHDSHRAKHSRGPAWLLFNEADVQNPPNATNLVRHLGVDTGLAQLTLTYLENTVVGATDMKDERWTIRVWHAWKYVQQMQKAIYSKHFETTRPDLWAATHPNQVVDASTNPPLSGNQNLVHFVQQSLLLDSKTRQFESVEKLNNGLRLRAQRALIAYLCALGRVSLTFTGKNVAATSSRDLSALLLQEIEVGLCEKSTRIEDAICAVHTFVQRLRLGLEPSFTVPHGFARKWDSTFCNYETWMHHQRRVLYKENWIQWEELQIARQSEAFSFFEKNLERHSLTLPLPKPPLAITLDENIPHRSPPEVVQERDLATLGAQLNIFDEGTSLIGTPAQAGQPTWLSATSVPAAAELPDSIVNGGGEGGHEGGDGNGGGGHINIRRELLPVSSDQVNIPLWFQAAIGLGTTFIRIAAAGLPPGVQANLHDDDDDDSSSSGIQRCSCGKKHDPLVDEYYFWLVRREYFDSDDAPQNADLGVAPPDPTTDWERDQLPLLLHWPVRAMVYLNWTRMHMGTFCPPRRSSDGIAFDPSSEEPSLQFDGRKADSLVFAAVSSNGQGFRYDIATDAAAVSPHVVPENFPKVAYPTPLNAYPYFIYFEPGAPIVPISSFGTALSVAGSLRTRCKFEEALAWCRLAFNPLTRDNTWPQCRRRELEGKVNEHFEEDSNPKTNAEGVGLHVRELAEEPPNPIQVDIPCCPSAPVKAGMARARAVTLEYIQILLHWGDTLMCANTNESINRGLILFNEAIRILGPKPGRVNAQEGGVGELLTVVEYTSVSAPLNPKLIHLYEEAFDRREMVQNIMSSRRLKNGMSLERNLTWKGNAIAAYSESTTSCKDPALTCCLPYRFTYYLGKAVELVGMVKALGGGLLSALEKGDTEYLTALRQTHDLQMTRMLSTSKQAAYREADWQVQVLEKQIEGALTRLRYNKQLLQNGLNSGETAFVSGTNIALGSRTASNISEGVGQGMSFIPDITLGAAGFGGSPVEINKLPLGSKLSQVFQSAARIMNVIGDVNSTNANLGSVGGGWDRRSEEWAHQVDVITLELAQLKRQQLAAERRRDMSLRDLNNHQMQLENSAEIENFMRDKISKQDLYLFLQQETVSLYRRGYDLAFHTAREAQQAFQHERRDLAIDLPVQAWDNLHSGLMAGEGLELALREMDRQYMRSNCREYELSKHLSLRLHFPFAFLQLKALGWCEVEIPEWIFDLDYPGQYMRRIKTVSVTVPCVAGPYAGVHCRMQLLSSRIRLSPAVPENAKCCCKGSCPGEETCGYDSYEGLSHQFIGTESIATSTGMNDSGLFELSFHDERVVPFEFSGAVSRWRIEMPPENNQFDLETLSDFIIHLNYTAREGSTMLRQAANKSAQRRLPGDGLRFFDIRHEFPVLWSHAFRPSPDMKKHARQQKQGSERNLPLQLSRRAFPFLIGRRSVTISNIHIFIEVDRSCALGGHISVHFRGEGDCKDEKTFPIVSSSAVPGFYRGVLENVTLGPLDDDEDHILGRLTFPQELRDAHVRQAYLLCYYSAGKPHVARFIEEERSSFTYEMRAKPDCAC